MATFLDALSIVQGSTFEHNADVLHEGWKTEDLYRARFHVARTVYNVVLFTSKLSIYLQPKVLPQ